MFLFCIHYLSVEINRCYLICPKKLYAGKSLLFKVGLRLSATWTLLFTSLSLDPWPLFITPRGVHWIRELWLFTGSLTDFQLRERERVHYIKKLNPMNMTEFLQRQNLRFTGQDLVTFSRIRVCTAGQHDWRVKFLPSQVPILARHYWCYPLTFHYFEPCSHYSYHLHKYWRHCRGIFFNKKIIHDSLNIRKYNVLSDPNKRRSQLLGLCYHTSKGHPRKKKKLQLKNPHLRKQNFRENNL